MDCDQMVLRLGYYCGIACRLLGDYSYALRVVGRAQEVTEAEYTDITSEIHNRLVAASLIAPDEDPYDSGL